MSRGRRISATEHGQYGFARRHKCRCEPCLAVQARYTKELTYDNYNNRPRQVPAQPVRDHVAGLLQAGGSVGMVAKATGGRVHRTQISRLLYGNPTTGKTVEQVYRATAERLLAVTVQEMLKYDGFVHPAGTRRRIQALGAMGHNKHAIAAVLGVNWSNIYEYTYVERINNATARNVKRAYDQLCMVQGDSEWMRWRARRLGWLPPLAWDEDTIDDPLAEPDLSAIKCVVENCSRAISAEHQTMLCLAHHRKVAARGGFRAARHYREAVLALGGKEIQDHEAFIDELRDCREMGMNPEEAARRLGRRPKTIAKFWKEAG